MCGICGKLIFSSDGEPPPPDADLILRMRDQLIHRGPDDAGLYLRRKGPWSVALGHRRLSIIDLSPAGRQPMSNEDGTLWVLLNGEVYNHQELRRELEVQGHRYRSKTDTESILHLYEEAGERCVERLRGMFALAIWDEARGLLMLARDRLGQKPLVYCHKPGELLFASEAKALLEDPSIERRLDPEALHDYLSFNYVPAPGTMFQGIRKLPPAHVLLWRGGPAEVRRYWKLSPTPKLSLSEEELCLAIRHHLEEATRLRLMSDVPLGALLSGGVDSSAVVAMMSRLGGVRVKTFSIGSEEERYNELPYARLVAERFETEHHEFIVKPDAVEVLPRLIWHFNEPFADSSALPSFYLAQMTRSHVTVALNGDAGDENFGGYERYVATKLAAWLDIIPRGVRAGLLGPLIKLLPRGGEEKSTTRRLRRFLEALLLSRERRYARWSSIMDDEFKDSLYTETLAGRLAQRDSYSHILRCYEEMQREAPDFLDATMLVDINSYLPDDLLVKMDIMTMAHSLEARSPFLDHHFMEFAARIPSHLKVRGKTTKYLLRKALGELLPREVLNRGKMGFGVPIGGWFRRELKDWVREILLDRRSLGRGYFRRKALEGLIAEHVRGLRDNGFLLWNLLNLELWHRQFIDSAPRAPDAALVTPESREGS